MYLRGSGPEAERAQVAAIAAVLTLALVVVALAVTQAVVVPEQNERAEFQHEQQVQQDMLDVRGAILGSADTASGQTATLRLGTTYPERTVLQNPQQPQGTLRVKSLGAGSVSNAVATNPETTDFWSGTARDGYSNSRILYDPGYNYYQNAPGSTYESSVLYRSGDDGMTMQSGQRLVDGKQLSLAFVDGERDISRTGTTTIEPRTLSASQVNVDLRSPNAEPVTIRIPTQIPESAWSELLASELDPAGTDPDAYVRSYSCTASGPDAPCGTLTLKMEPGVTYDAKLSKVGLEGSVTEPAAYVTALRDPDPIDEGKQRQFTVQVRDRYNNPVSGVELDIIQPSVGRVVGPVNSVGEIGAVTDEDGRATFTYRAPPNVPGTGATATLGVRAPGIPGQKGRVTYDIGIEDTGERIPAGELSPMLTAVSPDVTDDASGDFVRVNVSDPDGIDPSEYTLDLVNRDGTVRNTVALDAEGEQLLRVDAAETLPGGGDGQVYVVGGSSLPDEITVGELVEGRGDIYVVGPNAYDATYTDAGTVLTGLAAFAEQNGLRDGDVVLRASALAPAEGAAVVEGTAQGDLADADPGDDDGFSDVLDDQRGTVLLRQGSTVVDTFAYRSESGRITGVQPAAPPGNGDDEHVELRFERPTDLTDHTLSVVADGRRETVDLGPVAGRVGDPSEPVIGPVYVVGEGVNRSSFADEQGISTNRTVRASTLAPDGLGGDEFVPGEGGTARLRDEVGSLVDERPYDGIQRASIGNVVPLDATGGGAPNVASDEFARLDFGTAVDTTGWQLLVDDGDGTTERLDLTPLADTTDAAPGPVYLVGAGVDSAAFASARGIAADRVVSAASLAEGDLADADLFDDDGASLTLQEVAGDTVDTYAYGGGPAASIADATPRDATGAGGATDEFLRLDVDRAFGSAGWTLAIDGPGRVGRLDLGVPAARDTIAAGQDIYLVGRSVDRDRFAADRGVDPSQVVPFGAVAEPGLGMNALPEPSATLDLRDRRGQLVDRYEYDGPGGSPTTGAVTTVDPARGGDPSAEFARLDFTGPVDTSTGWAVVVKRTTAGPGTASATYALTDASVADAARTDGTVYLVGEGVDPATFAADRGVDPSQVFRFGDATVPNTDGTPTPEDVLSDLGGELRLQDGSGTTVDSAAWPGTANGRIDAVTPDTDGDFPDGNGATETDRDGWVRLAFPGGADTTDWTVTVDGADPGTGAATLDLGPADGPARDGGVVYVVGEGIDPATFAGDRGVDPSRVVRAASLASGGLPASFLADDGGTVTLRDATGTTVDTYAYGSDLRSGQIATVEARDATTATGDESSDEYVRVTFEQPVDTTGYDLTVRRSETDGQRRLTVSLDQGAPAVAAAGGPVYLVGETVDETRFAAEHGVTPGRVVVVDGSAGALGELDDSDVLTDGGATLTLRGDLDGDGTAETELDRYAYGTEAPRAGDWEHTFTGGTRDTTAYRERDDSGQYIDTDTADDWYDTGTLPGEDPRPASANVTVDGVEPTGSDVDGDGIEETTGVAIDLSNGDGPAEIVGFATDTTLASAVDAGGDREVDVPVDGGDDGFADADGSFPADGTRYRFANLDTLPGYEGESATVPSDATFEFDVGEYRTDDGSVADLGTLVPATAGDADLTVTLVFDDGSTERVHLRQRPADIEVNVTADKPAVGAGSEVTFSTTVENLGPGRATGPLRLSDGYDPRQFDVVSSSPVDGATYDPASGTWTIPDGLPAGESVTLNVTMNASGSTGEALPYTVARTDSAVADPNVDNDVDTASVTIGGADPYLEMTSPQDANGDGTARVDSGDTVTFELTVGNRGPGDIPGGLVVRDELPAGFIPLSHEASAGTYDPATGDWRLGGGLAEGTTETLTIEAVASPVPGPLNNTATIADVGTAGDRNTGNNVAFVTVEETERAPESGDGGDGSDGGDGDTVVCSDPTNLDDDETVLLWSTFETRGDDDAARLANASWSASGEGIAGVNDLTSETCGQSAYTADGEQRLTSPTVATDNYDLVEVAYWVQNGSDDYTADLPGSVSPSEAAAPDESEDLAVEFYGADGEWHRIDRIEQDDPALADGALERRVYLPGSVASHDEFRLRFHQLDGDQTDAGTDDFWHVDNVRIVGGPDDDGDIEPVVTGTTPVDGGDGDDGSGDEADDEEDDDNGHGNDCGTDPSNPSGNDPSGQEEDCENDDGSDDDANDGGDGNDSDDDECEVEEDDGSPGADDRGIGNNAGDTDPDNPALGSSWEGEEDGDCEGDDESGGTGDDGTADATFGYENSYPGAVYLTPGPELPTGLFSPRERNDIRVNQTTDPAGEEGPSVVDAPGVMFDVSAPGQYVLDGGTGLPGRFPAGSPDDVVTVSGLDAQQLVTWYLGDGAATAGGSGDDGDDSQDGDDDDGDNGGDDGDDSQDGDDDDGDNGGDDSDDSRKAISFVAACPAGDDIESFDITVTDTKDGGEPVAINWTSDEPVETVVLKAGPSMENFDADTAVVGEGTAAGSGQSTSSPCPDGDGVKYEWDGESFGAASDGGRDD